MDNACGVISKLGPLVNPKAAENRTSASFGGPVTQGTLTVAAATQKAREVRAKGYVLKAPLRQHSGRRRSRMGGGQAPAGDRLDQPALAHRLEREPGRAQLQVPEPAMAAGAAAALLVLVACHRAMNRRR